MLIDGDGDGDGVAVIRLAASAVFDADGIDAFAQAVGRAAADAAIRGVVIVGDGGQFNTGFDLPWLARVTAPELSVQALTAAVERLNAALHQIETCGKPFVAAIDGDALGAGMELALACGLRVVAARADAQLGLTDLKLGLPPAAGGALRLARLIGGARAQAQLLAARPMSPAQALRAAWVDDVVPPNRLLEVSKQLALQASPARPAPTWDAVAARPAELHQPAQAAQAAVSAMLNDAARMAFGAALDAAARRFIDIARGSTARNMLRTLGLSVARANALARRPQGISRRHFRKVGVLGAGLMGGGIALVCARAGLDVALIDVSLDAARRGLDRLRQQEESAIAAGRTDADAARAALARITPTDRYESLHDADIVVEAVFEDRAVKADATRRAEAAMAPGVVFATNTSTLPIHSLAAASVRPAQFIGTHFFSPVPRMPLLEIIRGAATSDATLAAAMDFAQAIGKTPIIVNDARGFYTTRVVMAYQAEAFDMLAQGVAPERVEEGGVAAGMPVPPLALSDAVALDLIHQINVQTLRDLGDVYPHSAGYELVARMVEQMGRTGKKTGRGFYDYATDGSKRLWSGLPQAAGGQAREAPVDDVRDRLLAAQALETVRALDDGVISDPSEADVGAILGWGFAPWTGGPLSYIDSQGVAAFVARCDELAGRYGSERLRPTASLRRIAASGGSVYATTWPLRCGALPSAA